MAKIVVIEDEQSIANALKFNLEMEGYAVSIYTRGRDVVENMHSICNSDLLILDVMLPDINGIELCNRIRKESDVPVLFLCKRDD